MPETTLPFGEWLPDQPELNNPGALIARNVYPSAQGYLPAREPIQVADALPSKVLGLITAQDTSAQVNNFAGTASSLHRLVSGSWTDVTRLAGPYAVANKTWQFAQWENDIYAAQVNDDVQSFRMGTDTEFKNETLMPRAGTIAVVRNFLALGNVWESGVFYPYRIRVSDRDNPTGFTIGSPSLSISEDLRGERGFVQKIIGGEYGMIFQEYAITRMSLGGPGVWQFDEVLRGRGTPSPNSVVRVGQNIYYLSQQGFEVIEGGSASIPIGRQKVDRFFYKDVKIEELSQVCGVSDSENRRILWCYPNSSSGLLERILCYSWDTGRWSEIVDAVELLGEAATPGFAIDTADSLGDMDDVQLAVDSRVLAGGVREVAAFDGTHTLVFFDGANKDGILDTEERALSGPDKLSRLQSARPLVDGGSPAVQPIYRNKQIDKPFDFIENELNLDPEGKTTLRNEARYHRFRVRCRGDWKTAQGVHVQWTQRGRR